MSSQSQPVLASNGQPEAEPSAAARFPRREFTAKLGRGYSAVGLVQPKTPANVGSVLRAAGCYSVDLVAVEGERGRNSLITSNCTDTMKAWRHIPTLLTDNLFSVLPVGCVPVAVDLLPAATSLVDFIHPQSAFYIFGPEDGTLGERHAKLGMARVFVPTRRCMNLAATVNVVLYDRLAKATRAANADTSDGQASPGRPPK